MAAKGPEKRGFIRVPFETHAEIKAGNRSIRSRSGLNISMGGVGFSTDQPVPAAGTRVSARIVLAGTPVVIAAEGIVVRTAPGTLAVEFTEIDLDSYHHLRSLIATNAEDPEQADEEFGSHWGIRRPS
jgi:hypothetical protein